MAPGPGSRTVLCAGSGHGLTALLSTDRATARCAACDLGANTAAGSTDANPTDHRIWQIDRETHGEIASYEGFERQQAEETQAMANEAHLARLKEGVEVWNAWRITNPNVQLNFYEADLGGANLGGANLRGADLQRANLSEAILTRAILSRATLDKATLDGADLHEATLGWTIWGNVDLSTASGLETIQHQGPSTIGIDTLYRSHGHIPEVFLRRAGLPEDFNTYVKSLVSRPFEYYSCFISYSHADQSFARRLHDQLQGRGIRCWLDEHQMLPGDDIYEQIDRGIRFWDKVLLCCSQASLTSWWVDQSAPRSAMMS